MSNYKLLWFLLLGAFIVAGGIMMFILVSGGDTPDHVDIPPEETSSSATP